MPRTLADYAETLTIPPYGRFQRLLCRLCIHRWHREYHKWQHDQSIITRFTGPMPELQNLPWRKIDGATYTYRASEAD